MSQLTDPLKIAAWLISRAGNTNGAVDYKNTIEKAKGLLLNPNASGEEAVRVARVMKEQGAIVRKNEVTATPAAAAQTPAPDAATVAAAAAATAATAAAATAATAPSEAAPAAAAPEAAPAAAAPEAAPAVEAAPEAAPAAAAPETDENISGSSRRTRHRTPKRKKLSRKKTNKRK